MGWNRTGVEDDQSLILQFSSVSYSVHNEVILMQNSNNRSRREFIEAGLAGAVALAGAPRVVTASRTRDEIVIGEGDHQFRVDHTWPQLPDSYTWQTTHGVAVDAAGNLYVIHMGHSDASRQPTIYVFDSEGRFVRAFGEQYHGGGHGIEIRREGNEEFIYVAAYQHIKTIAKLTLMGDIVWEQHAPMESGVYKAGEDKDRTKERARDRFAPTNFAFADDGGFWMADGYGSFRIHRYDKDGNWLSCFGGPGEGQGTFNTAHGLWLDKRGSEPQLVVTDRAHHTLQTFTPEGDYKETLSGFELPANIDIRGNLMLVPELFGKITLLDEQNRVVTRMDAGRSRLDDQKDLRKQPSDWRDGEFIHPHDACFTAGGDILVAEWVGSGRISKLTRI